MVIQIDVKLFYLLCGNLKKISTLMESSQFCNEFSLSEKEISVPVKKRFSFFSQNILLSIYFRSYLIM